MGIIEKHPAPWNLSNTRTSQCEYSLTDANGETIRYGEGAHRLMLAAPELLEALNNLLNSICLDDLEPPSEEMENARELIARIDGDSCP